MSQPIIHTFFDEITNTATHLILDPKNKCSAVIDSVLGFDLESGKLNTNAADKIIEFIKKNKLNNEWILETHIHADHLTASSYLKKNIGGKTGISAEVKKIQEYFAPLFNIENSIATQGTQFDKLFTNGETFKIGSFNTLFLQTPGHTSTCSTYLIEDNAFVGDALLMPDLGTGRTDFPGGSAKKLYKSICEIFKLPAFTKIYVCHDYKNSDRNILWKCDVQEQRKKNIHVNDSISEREFIKTRTNRDKMLKLPKLYLPSIQVNINAGVFPTKNKNGTAYLKIPVNTF